MELKKFYQADPHRYDREASLYARCGKSGVLLPRVSLGFWHNFGGIDPYERSRAITHYAFDHGIAGAEMTVETDAGIVPGWRVEENIYRVKLNNPGVMDLRRRPDAAYVELGDPGVPHGVVEVPNLTFDMREDLRQRAKALRYDPAFPKGANINFYTWLGQDRVRVLTYERGVEDYTLACGTGCGSVTSTLFSQGKLPEGKLTCENQGGILQVSVRAEDCAITEILLQGPAEILKIYEL